MINMERRNGRELAREYFEAYGKPMLEREFPEVLPYLAAGFTGSGSEHYGFDDETSRDHDFEPGFCIFLPDETVVDRRAEFLLSRAYAKLPQEFDGVKRLSADPVGGSRHGVMRTADFYYEKAGVPKGTAVMESADLPADRAALPRGSGMQVLSQDVWLRIPDYVLAEAVNGEVYFDNYGEFTRIREALQNMPEDIRLKRIAGNLLLMGQSGQYNFGRCLSHGEPEAAQLAATQFVTSAMKVLFLANGRYMPFYKWSFRALRKLLSGYSEGIEKETSGSGQRTRTPAGLTGIDEKLSFLLRGDNADPRTAAAKKETIEEISTVLSELLRAKGILTASGSELEPNAYAVNERIKDVSLRGRNIFSGT